MLSINQNILYEKGPLSFPSFLFIGAVATAQQTVSGKSIIFQWHSLSRCIGEVEKTGKLTYTAADGSFRLSVASDDEVEISVGYKTQQ